jgi:predicted aspartyl protease
MARRLVVCSGALVAAAVLAFPASAASPPAGQKSCALKQYASLHVDRTYGGRPSVPVVIGAVTVQMWLNTSSALSMLNQSAVERLGLKAQPLRFGTPPINIGNVAVKAAVRVPVMSLGNARFENTEIVVNPENATVSDAHSPAEAPAGVLGMDLLANLDVEFDLGHDTINLFSPDHCPDSAVYWAQRYDVVPMHRGALHDLYFVIELDGKKVQAKLSTSGERSTLAGSIAKQVYGWDTSPDVRDMSLNAGGLTVLNAQISRDSHETECMKQSRIVTDNDHAIGFEGCLGAYPLRLGTGVLNKLHLYLSTKEEKLYFTMSDSPTPAPIPAPEAQ